VLLNPLRFRSCRDVEDGMWADIVLVVICVAMRRKRESIRFPLLAVPNRKQSAILSAG
jgi:hypothetical protein